MLEKLKEEMDKIWLIVAVIFIAVMYYFPELPDENPFLVFILTLGVIVWGGLERMLEREEIDIRFLVVLIGLLSIIAVFLFNKIASIF